MNIKEISPVAVGARFTMREWLRQVISWRHVAILTVVILLFAQTGPFGTYTRLSGEARFLYWLLAIGGNWALGLFAASLRTHLMTTAGMARQIGLVISALLMALPGTGLVLLLEAWLAEPLHMASELAYVYASVALIHTVLGYLVQHLLSRGLGSETIEPAQVPATTPRFLQRLSPELGTGLVHLRMRDHYVEARTERGAELVLMRFGDALEELDGLDGIRVHRSHWVATNAIKAVIRQSGRLFIELRNHERVPVSRSYRHLVEKAVADRQVRDSHMP